MQLENPRICRRDRGFEFRVRSARSVVDFGQRRLGLGLAHHGSLACALAPQQFTLSAHDTGTRKVDATLERRSVEIVLSNKHSLLGDLVVNSIEIRSGSRRRRGSGSDLGFHLRHLQLECGNLNPCGLNHLVRNRKDRSGLRNILR
ncbi:unannotated protein [freshwater metagenome]|uniref:Unannotated protein n=1 Tax=freshwater metagenome TaxID=449393 RepID=A0A6J6JFU1_9ZZZZ